MPKDYEIPRCSLCGATLTFYFQTAMPKGCEWHGKTISLFSCVDCADDYYCIPMPYRGGDSPQDIFFGGFNMVGRNYEAMVFDTEDAEIVDDYRERIIFRRWNLIECPSSLKCSKLGGSVNLTQDDLSPRTCDSRWEMLFLLQLEADFRFAILPDAPRQMVYDDFGNSQVPVDEDYCELFLSNWLFIFGSWIDGSGYLYLLSQRP